MSSSHTITKYNPKIAIYFDPSCVAHLTRSRCAHYKEFQRPRANAVVRIQVRELGSCVGRRQRRVMRELGYLGRLRQYL